MRIVILPESEAVAAFAALEIAQQVSAKPTSVLGLATGGTPLGAYRQLIQLYRDGKLTFDRVTTFNLDEYVGLGPDHAASYRVFMQTHLFDQINITNDQTHLPRGDADDLQSECAAYEEKLQRAGGIDLQLLGIGTDGHIAFNEPGSSLASRTRIKTLTESTLRDNARFFSSIDEVPTTAVTMGIGTILDAKRILLLATGPGKADAVLATVEGPITSLVPASALQLHADVTIAMDKEAACLLKHKDYYLRSEVERKRLRSE